MLEAARELERRTKALAIAVLRLLRHLPATPEASALRYQLGKAATSVPANYRATCRSRSRAEFLARMAVVSEEADESVFWLEVLIEADMLPQVRAVRIEAEVLLRESRELRAIFSSSVATLRRGNSST